MRVRRNRLRTRDFRPPRVIAPGFAAVAGISLMLAACASGPTLLVDSADEPFHCSSIAWLESAGLPASIAEQRLRNEAMMQLAELGYAEDTEAPDCLVTGGLFSGSRPTSPASVGVGAGRWGGSFGTSVGVSLPVGGTRSVSNLAIDVIDRERNVEVWRGTLQSAFRTPDPTAAEMAQAVRTILVAFPRAN
jgi:hypothetical protein